MLQRIVDFIASIGAEAEAFIHPDAVTLPGFPRSLQLDGYSCGAKAVYCILQYYGIQCTPDSVEEQLHTDEDVTSVGNIKRVLNRYGLAFQPLRKHGLQNLKAAINNDCPVLISVYNGSHYSVVYGYSDSHIFVSNPSLNVLTGYGSLSCAITKSEFRKMWDKWAVVVSK